MEIQVRGPVHLDRQAAALNQRIDLCAEPGLEVFERAHEAAIAYSRSLGLVSVVELAQARFNRKAR